MALGSDVKNGLSILSGCERAPENSVFMRFLVDNDGFSCTRSGRVDPSASRGALC